MPGPTSLGLGFLNIMTPIEQIKKTAEDLEQVWTLIQDLEANNVPADHMVFDMQADRLEYLLNKYFVIIEKYPECRYTVENNSIFRN